MIRQIKELYKTFGDAKIERIEYSMTDVNSSDNDKTLVIYISCLNWRNEHWEHLKLECMTVTKVRFVDTSKIQNSIVFEALLDQRENGIVIDFFPIQVDGLGTLEEDPNSTFSVHCGQINCTVI